MDIEKLIEDLHGILKQYGEKIPYGELVGAPWPYSRAGDLVWPDPEPYFIEQAATALSTLQAENEKLRDEVESLKKGYCAGCSIPAVKAEQIRDLTDAPKLRAELEQVKMECDAAKSTLAERIGVRGAEPITTAFGLPIDRLRELAKADREGRCVVLPCKVEDDVYINILGRTLPFTVISISQMSSTPTFKAQHGIRLVYIFKADDVGETVFMTRAEAESALQGEREEKQ